MSGIEGPIPAVAAATSTQAIDPCFVFPKEQRWDIPHDSFDVDLPVIDLAPVLNLRRLQKEIGPGVDSKPTSSSVQAEIERWKEASTSVERQIRAACEEYGFFQVINHGFPEEVVEKLKESGRQIFDLPLEKKMKASQVPPTEGKPLPSPGYAPIIRNTKQKNGKLAWNEVFGMDFPELLYPGQLEQQANALWPEEPERTTIGLQLRSIVEQYGEQANSLSILVLDLMAASLGLPEGATQGSLGSGPRTHLEARGHVVRYPSCPQPELTFGLDHHTDPSLITLLHQDNVGGLQIRFKDGSWHGVRPLQGSVVINVGNFLQAVTNGRFISAEHRVVGNSRFDRFSIAYFVLDSIDSVFSPRPELVDAEHPLLYRPFSRREYLHTIQKSRRSDKRILNFTDLFQHRLPS